MLNAQAPHPSRSQARILPGKPALTKPPGSNNVFPGQEGLRHTQRTARR
jgi:hypothetical protein